MRAHRPTLRAGVPQPLDSSIAVAQQYATAYSAGILYLPLFGDITGGVNRFAGTKMPQ